MCLEKNRAPKEVSREEQGGLGAELKASVRNIGRAFESLGARGRCLLFPRPLLFWAKKSIYLEYLFIPLSIYMFYLLYFFSILYISF
mgnify:CR=1 FL=1